VDLEGRASVDSPRMVCVCNAGYGTMTTCRPKMHRAGLKESWFPMAEASVMGTTEVLTALPRLWSRLQSVTKRTVEANPDLVLTVDGKGFNFRFLARFSKAWQQRVYSIAPATDSIPPRLHVVAPSRWALHRLPWGLFSSQWNQPPKQQDLSDIMDELLTILPFEPGHFSSSAYFVGHPALESGKRVLFTTKVPKTLPEHYPKGFCPSPEAFIRHNPLPPWAMLPLPSSKASVAAPTGGQTLGFFPGSRLAEIESSLILLEEMLPLLENTQALVSSTPATHDMITRFVSTRKLDVKVVCDATSLMHMCSIAVAVSGTIATELAVNGVPTVVFYQGSTITQWVAKRLAKVKYVTLANIIGNAEIVPEFVFEHCQADAIAEAVRALSCGNEANKQLASLEDVLRYMVLWDKESGLPLKPSAVIAHRIWSALEYRLNDS